MGASIGFIRDCRFLHTPRTILNISTVVTGTGFLMPKRLINPKTGWKYSCIVEDSEFSMDNIGKGEKIIYCDDAIFYDEQPETWKSTYRQRMRWQKGAYLIYKGFAGSMILKFFSKFSFTIYDNLMYFTPVPIISTSWALLNGLIAVVTSFLKMLMGYPVGIEILSLIGALAFYFVMLYLGLFLYGSLAVIKDWKRIKATTKKKIIAMFAYPIFMICIIPIYFIALFSKVEWKPIEHKEAVDIEELNKIK